MIELDATATATLRDLDEELDWLARSIALRLRLYFPTQGDPVEHRSIFDVPPPSLDESRSDWAAFVRDNSLDHIERAAVVMALASELRPHLFDVFFAKNATFDRRFTEFGGLRVEDEFEPTGETLAFLIGGDSLAARAAVGRILDAGSRLISSGVLRIGSASSERPAMKSPLRLSSELSSLFIVGRRHRHALGAEFPAQRIETDLDWADLVLHPGTSKQIDEIHAFVLHGETLMRDWGMASRLRPGHRALFHGPPGTGKSLSVALIGKVTRREVFRIDLSLVVSKYIGETEKNLARVFDRAQQQSWILFFDEAEALFGRRTETREAHDRYANQEVAYLLQRIETFSGIAILASNLRENLDEAFMRRFESVVYFPLPGKEDRLRLWRRGFSPKAQLSTDCDLEEIARDHELSGGSIMNVIRQVSLASIAAGGRQISREDLMHSIRRELAKEGRR